MKLRPSALPKLAECPCYESEEDAGEAAARGTRMDECFRAGVAGQPWPHTLESDEVEAVRWAIDTFRLYAGGAPCTTAETDLAISLDRFGMVGTADGACIERAFSIDLKSGEIRNYREQMAAYAVGFMEREFLDEWTTHVLFCDERRVVSEIWTMAEAVAVVQKVYAAFHTPEKTPTPCDYCGWCAARYRCAARIEQVAWAMGIGADEIDFERLDADPTALADLTVRANRVAKVLEDVLEHGKSKLLPLVAAGEKFQGISFVKGRRSESLPHDCVGRHIQQLGFGPVLAAYGDMSVKRARALWEKCPDLPFPEAEIQVNNGAAYLRFK